MIVILSVLCREIRVGVTAGVDVIEGGGFLRACVFRIPLYKTIFDFDLTSKTVAPAPVKATADAAIKVTQQQRHPFKSVMAILTNLRIRCVETEIHIGSVRDPLFTTLAYGSVRVLLYSALIFLKSRYPSAQISTPLIPEYRTDCCYLRGSAVVYISIADLVYGLFKLFGSKFHTRKNLKIRSAPGRAQRSVT